MEEIIAYLNKQGQASYANQLLVYLERGQAEDEEKKMMKGFIGFVVKEVSKKLPRERILFSIVEEAKKQGFMR